MGSICNLDAANSRAGRAIGEPIGPVAINDPAMHKFMDLTAAAIMLVSSDPAPVLARDRAAIKSANLAPIAHRDIWYYDLRDDVPDLPTNGFFPANFAAK